MIARKFLFSSLYKQPKTVQNQFLFRLFTYCNLCTPMYYKDFKCLYFRQVTLQRILSRRFLETNWRRCIRPPDRRRTEWCTTGSRSSCTCRPIRRTTGVSVDAPSPSHFATEHIKIFILKLPWGNVTYFFSFISHKSKIIIISCIW